MSFVFWVVWNIDLWIHGSDPLVLSVPSWTGMPSDLLHSHPSGNLSWSSHRRLYTAKEVALAGQGELGPFHVCISTIIFISSHCFLRQSRPINLIWCMTLFDLATYYIIWFSLACVLSCFQRACKSCWFSCYRHHFLYDCTNTKLIRLHFRVGPSLSYATLTFPTLFLYTIQNISIVLSIILFL